MAAAGAALAWSDANHYVTSQSLFCYCCCAPSFPPSLRCKPGLFVPQLVRQKKKPRDPSHNSPWQPRGAPSPAPASLLGQCPAACYCHRAVSPAFSGLPITPVVILNLLSFSPSTCLYLLKPRLSPPHPPPEYFVSAPVSREQPSARLPPGSLPIYEPSHHFFFSFQLCCCCCWDSFCSAALSCSPASQRNRWHTAESLPCSSVSPTGVMISFSPGH